MIDLDKIKGNRELVNDDISHYFVNNRKNKNYFVGSIGRVIKNHQYDGVLSKYDVNKDSWDLYKNKPKYGVWQKIRGEWRWSYINTIETNYSAIFELVNFYNDLIKKGRIVGEKITYLSLSESFKEECDRLISFIEKYFDRVFGLREVTELSNKLVVATSYTWYSSMFSELSYVRNTIRGTDMIPIYGKDRGKGDDYNKGIDFSIIKNEVTFNYQHKICNDTKNRRVQVILDDENDCVIIPTPIHKGKYKDVDYLIVENNKTIYVFNIEGNGTDDTIIVSNTTTTIPNNRLIDVFDRVDDEMVELLTDIFRKCMSLSYEFNIYDSLEPFVDFDTENKRLTIGFEGINLESVHEDLLDILNQF